MVLRFEQRQILVDEVDVPRAFDLGNHDHVQLVADRLDQLRHVVEEPGAVQRVDANPQGGVAEIGRAGDLDKAGPCRFLGIDRNRVFQIAAQHVDLLGGDRDLGADLLDVRRKEMDHPLRPHRQFTQRLRCADGQRFVEVNRWLSLCRRLSCRSVQDRRCVRSDGGGSSSA